jgi:hypothetical protein
MQYTRNWGVRNTEREQESIHNDVKVGEQAGKQGLLALERFEPRDLSLGQG